MTIPVKYKPKVISQVFFPFLIDVVLRHLGYNEDFIELVILTYRKPLNISELLLIIFMGMSLVALFVFNLLNS